MTEPTAKVVHLSVVIPAWNEARRIGRSMAEIGKYLAGKPFASEVIVVDDGSTDGTGDAALDGMEGRVPTRILPLDRNRGKGFAVRAGILVTAGEFILFSDADLSTPIDEFDKFEPWLEWGDDVVIGSRALKESDVRIRQMLLRQTLGKFFNVLVRLLVMKGIRDTQCGFKAFKRAAAFDLFSALETPGFGFDVELLLRARQKGYRIREVPVVWRNSRPSRVRLVRGSWRMLEELWRIRRLR